MSDIQIARKANLKNILEITEKLKIDDKYINQYGKYKAKISYDIYSNIKNNKNGKLILVTSINPTPMGEGKTTVSIGLADAINRIVESKSHDFLCLYEKHDLGTLYKKLYENKEK